MKGKPPRKHTASLVNQVAAAFRRAQGSRGGVRIARVARTSLVIDDLMGDLQRGTRGRVVSLTDPESGERYFQLDISLLDGDHILG